MKPTILNVELNNELSVEQAFVSELKILQLRCKPCSFFSNETMATSNVCSEPNGGLPPESTANALDS